MGGVKGRFLQKGVFFCEVLCTVLPQAYSILGNKQMQIPLECFLHLGCGRKNTPNRKENEVAKEETNKGVSADYIYIFVSQPIQRF